MRASRAEQEPVRQASLQSLSHQIPSDSEAEPASQIEDCAGTGGIAVVARINCDRCGGRMFVDLEGEASCVMCGWSGWPIAAESVEARELAETQRWHRPTRYETKKLQGAALASYRARMKREAA